MINFKTIQQSSIIVIVTFLCAFSISAYATEFHVTTSQELQTALSTAAENNQSDSIFLAAGTYKGNFRFETEESDTSISIQAEEGLNAGNVILDGEERDRVLSINSGENKVNVNLDRLTIQNGNTDVGAGVFIETNGESIIINCNFFKNICKTNGGGIYISKCSKISILQTNIDSNTVSVPYNGSGHGGGIFISSSNSDTIIQYNKISNNISNLGSSKGNTYASAIYISTNNLKLKSNRIFNNTKARTYYIYINSKSTEIADNFISNNISSTNGLYISSPELQFFNNQVVNNQGGSYFSIANSAFIKSNFFSKDNSRITVNSKQISIINNIITKNTNNSTSTQGAGLYVSSTETINLINNILSENFSKSQGGGLYVALNDNTILNLYNNIIWGNTAEQGGGDIYLNGYGSKKNFYNNNVHDIVGTFDFAANNIDVAPLFINTEKDDFHLGAGSLCINAGTNDAPELPAIDMDGNPRIGDDIVDIGAYEHSSTDYHPADTNNDWSLSSEEVSAYETAWKNGNTWSTGPSQIPMNYLTRAGFIHQSGSAYKNAGGAKPLCWIPVE